MVKRSLEFRSVIPYIAVLWYLYGTFCDPTRNLVNAMPKLTKRCVEKLTVLKATHTMRSTLTFDQGLTIVDVVLVVP